MKKLLIFAGFILTLSVPASAQVATGGNYRLDQTVIAGGGGTSTDAANNVYRLDAAVGQPIASSNASNPPYSVQSGFYTAAPAGPTAATASVGGRVLTANGRGIRSVTMTLTDSRGVSRTATTGAFGYFQFNDVTAGEVYILSARGKRFRFEQNDFVISVNENLTELNFIALP